MYVCYPGTNGLKMLCSSRKFFLPFQEDEFKDMLKADARIEFHYSHWFDEVIVNDDLSSAFELLVAAVNRVETEPLWVPASWVQ